MFRDIASACALALVWATSAPAQGIGGCDLANFDRTAPRASIATFGRDGLSAASDLDVDDISVGEDVAHVFRNDSGKAVTLLWTDERSGERILYAPYHRGGVPAHEVVCALRLGAPAGSYQPAPDSSVYIDGQEQTAVTAYVTSAPQSGAGLGRPLTLLFSRWVELLSGEQIEEALTVDIAPEGDIASVTINVSPPGYGVAFDAGMFAEGLEPLEAAVSRADASLRIGTPISLEFVSDELRAFSFANDGSEFETFAATSYVIVGDLAAPLEVVGVTVEQASSPVFLLSPDGQVALSGSLFPGDGVSLRLPIPPF